MTDPTRADGAGLPTDPAAPSSSSATASARSSGDLAAPVGELGRRVRGLRGEIPWWWSMACAAACMLLVLGAWTLATWGPGEERWLSPTTLGSPAETWRVLGRKTLLADGTEQAMDVRLLRNTFASLKRVLGGFVLATCLGVPIGVVCGCFASVNSFVRPLVEFGRNVPMMALVALTFAFFGVAETQKVMFIFMATVAFVVFDTAQAVRDVPQTYVDTAYTLGASRWQIVLKVLVPLAMPAVFNSLRLLFGLAFGYITLAEAVGSGGDQVGLGGLIILFQRRGPREGITLILILIPLVAFAIDRGLYWVQTQLFPYRFGGPGLLAKATRWLHQQWESVWRLVFPAREFASVLARLPGASRETRDAAPPAGH